MRWALGLLWWLQAALACAQPIAIQWAQTTWQVCQHPGSEVGWQCGDWRAVELPLLFRPSASGQERVTVRVPFTVPTVGTDPVGLYVPYLHHGARVSVNGHVVALLPGASRVQEVRWERPLLWQLPPALLHAGRNELIVEMQPGLDRHTLRMAAIEIGEWLPLERQRARRDFLVRGVPQLTVLMCAFIATFLSMIWLMRPREVIYGLLALAMALWGVRTATFLVEVLPHDHWLIWRCAYHGATGGFIVILAGFARLYARRPVPRAWVVGGLFWAVAGPAFLAVAGVQWEPLVKSYWTAGLVPVAAVGVHAIYLGARQSGMAGQLLLLAALVAFVAGVHDLLMSAQPEWLTWLGRDWMNQRLFLLHHAANLMLLSLAAMMTRRFVDTLRELGRLNRTLEQKVQAREAALQEAFREQARLMVHHATEEERQRIVIDMHDGLGSRLFTTLTRVERGAATPDDLSRSLRACIEDMRLMIDALSPGAQTLSSALANFRHRWDDNLQALGIDVQWRWPEAVDAQALGPRQVLQLLQILQEALTNIIKHAGASSVHVAAWITPDHVLQVEVLDNGKGLETGVVKPGRGLGNMQRRAEAMGGRLQVEGHERGTRVVLSVPAGSADGAAARPEPRRA